ncbi:hypothetical protein T01_3803, partial [Trichinella spiralis]
LFLRNSQTSARPMLLRSKWSLHLMFISIMITILVESYRCAVLKRERRQFWDPFNMGWGMYNGFGGFGMYDMYGGYGGLGYGFPMW